jgi:hypothetical protein
VEIIEACSGLRVWPGGDHECLWITGLAGLKGVDRQSGDPPGLCRPEGLIWQRLCESEGWEFGVAQPWWG